MDSQSSYLQSLETSRECFQLVSERERAWVTVDLQTTTFVVSFDTAERFSLISFSNFLHSSESARPIDTDSSVTCLTYGDIAECQKVFLILTLPDPQSGVGWRACDSIKVSVDPWDPIQRWFLFWLTLQFRKLRTRSTNIGEVTHTNWQDLSFSMSQALTDACTLPAKWGWTLSFQDDWQGWVVMQSIARLMQTLLVEYVLTWAVVTFSSINEISEVSWVQSDWMTINDPSLQSEDVIHSDSELHGESNRWIFSRRLVLRSVQNSMRTCRYEFVVEASLFLQSIFSI